jgi:hypothetical protein
MVSVPDMAQANFSSLLLLLLLLEEEAGVPPAVVVVVTVVVVCTRSATWMSPATATDVVNTCMHNHRHTTLVECGRTAGR